jgi:hypothetical protein
MGGNNKADALTWTDFKKVRTEREAQHNLFLSPDNSAGIAFYDTSRAGMHLGELEKTPSVAFRRYTAGPMLFEG